MFKFTTFSERQKMIMTWWTDDSPFRDMYGIIADGSIRSGKSTAMSISFVMWAMERFDNRKFALCGKTVGSLRRNVVNDLIVVLENNDYNVIDRKGEGCLYISKNGHRNMFYQFAGNDERSQDLIQGVTLAGVLFDEVALMPQSFVNQATGRCSVEGSKLWFNCNPGGSRLHWFKQEWINEHTHKKILYLHFTMDDNLSLSEEVKERYRNMYVGVFYRRYIEGRWVAAEGVIYDMFDLKENIYTEEEVEPDYNERYTHYIGIDYGAVNPMVYLDVVDTHKELLVRNEYYFDYRKTANRTQKTNSEYADDFEEFVNRDHSVTVIIDPSAESFALELRNRGYRIVDAKNAVLDGIRLTATMIKQRRLRVLKNKCPNMLHEFESYIWDEKAALRGEEQPVKENDHAMDAIRYVVKTLITRRRMTL